MNDRIQNSSDSSSFMRVPTFNVAKLKIPNIAPQKIIRTTLCAFQLCVVSLKVLSPTVPPLRLPMLIPRELVTV